MRIILGTGPGERVMRPDFGAGLPALVFEPISATTLALARHRVEEALILWEPRIDSIEVGVTADAPRWPPQDRGRLPRARDQHVLQPGLSVLPDGGTDSMSRVPPPLLDPLTTESCVADAESKVPAFVPGWEPGPAGPGAALIQVYARFLKSLADRLNQAPDKNKMGFFDRLGIELLPAQAARAPVVFKPIQGMPDTAIPSRTRVGANAPDGGAPLVFETEDAIALTKASLAQVVSLWPGRDAWRDHTPDLVAGRAFQLFEALEPVPHVLYIAHDTALALAGPSLVEVALELTSPGPAPVRVIWEYWDGKIWRAFKDALSPALATDTDPVDLTVGLTRSGLVRLATDCGSSARTTVNGVTSRWIRARLEDPLPPAPNSPPATIDRINLISVVDRTLSRPQWVQGRGIVPEQAFGGEVKLDLTKTVTPLGARPEIGSALYLACEEAMTRPGAQVTLRVCSGSGPPRRSPTSRALP